MQAPSFERPKTNQRTPFLSFAINNCYPTSDEKMLAAFELILGDFLPLENSHKVSDLFGGFLYGHHRSLQQR
jgi:hypothetical protein